MKKYNIDVNINGKLTLEVEAESFEEAKLMVKDILDNSSFKEIVYKGNLNVLVKQHKKDMER